MSQQLIPVTGGVNLEVQTSSTASQLNVLSSQFTEAKKLQDRPTEWVEGGRPIYRRLPAVSETYQVDFFNLVNEPSVSGNSFTGKRLSEVGYVYIPIGQGLSGVSSCSVLTSETKKDLLIQGGTIVWRYGKTEVLPTIVNLPVINILSGKYAVAYQLIYDDAPIPQIYEVNDFALTGVPLNITSSTDDVIGWRYTAVNAFLNTSNYFWSNRDTLFPPYADPSFEVGYTPFLQWESEYGQAYSEIFLRCPPGTGFSGTANLSYYDGAALSPVTTTSVEVDSTSQFFKFTIKNPSFNTGWRVSFSDPSISVQSITVTGALTLLQPQSAPSPRATLVIYPIGALPSTVLNSQGEEVPATYCQLAEVNVDVDFIASEIHDTRNIVYRDYAPIADWLTLPFDEDLIDLYQQVKGYASLWMAPPTALAFEYPKLETSQISVVL